MNGQLIIREAEVAFEPVEKRRLEDTARAIKGISCKPYQFGFMKSQIFCLLQLFPQFILLDQIAKTYLDRAIDQGKRRFYLWEALPDELEHEKFVEVGVEEGPSNRIQFPVMVMGAPRKVDNHDATTLLQFMGTSQPGDATISTPTMRLMDECAILEISLVTRQFRNFALPNES